MHGTIVCLSAGQLYLSAWNQFAAHNNCTGAQPTQIPCTCIATQNMMLCASIICASFITEEFDNCGQDAGACGADIHLGVANLALQQLVQRYPQLHTTAADMMPRMRTYWRMMHAWHAPHARHKGMLGGRHTGTYTNPSPSQPTPERPVSHMTADSGLGSSVHVYTPAMLAAPVLSAVSVPFPDPPHLPNTHVCSCTYLLDEHSSLGSSAHT